ncbi:hypothetical protein B0T21DRAFT_354097 [Apiosordaria backusii]|uniref:SnoaL-like domain-containing protein n=1 Tax=Apiosordaria backusii TaxID=314023 RepID=A0AA40K638_9PEZI|nr:hypothetical protein B0T21DRAFT_354097 [Apiosordaria backusii]
MYLSAGHPPSCGLSGLAIIFLFSDQTDIGGKKLHPNIKMPTDIVPYEVAELIRRKKAVYCRYADAKQWHLFSEFALPEATFTFVEALTPDIPMSEGGQDLSFPHRDAFLDYFRARNKDLQCIHSVGPGELYFVDGEGSEKEVKAVWSAIYQVGDRNETKGIHGTGGGYYHEVWVKRGDDWFMKSLMFERVYWKLQM